MPTMCSSLERKSSAHAANMGGDSAELRTSWLRDTGMINACQETKRSSPAIDVADQARVSAEQYEVFERMHYVCFPYEFEHDPADPDEECQAGGCPSASLVVGRNRVIETAVELAVEAAEGAPWANDALLCSRNGPVGIRLARRKAQRCRCATW